MVNRRDIKAEHEKAVLKSFTAHLRKGGKTMEVLCVPEPPDAFVNIDGNKEWLEITDSFHDEAYANSITSYAASDKEHVPSGGILTDPDAYKKRMFKNIEKKYSKDTMLKISEENGPGILLLGVLSPFASDVSEIVSENAHKINNYINKFPTPVFKKIYVFTSTSSEFELIYSL